MNNTDIGRELSWDDEIEKDAGEFIILPDGDYTFTVTSFERGRFEGSEKLTPCPMAIIHLKIDNEQGPVTVQHRLFLHTKTEGMISAFFSAIGLKKKGEKLKMDWTQVAGSYGRCKLGTREWTSNSGEVMKSNEVKRFYPKEEKTYTVGTF